MRCSDRHKLLTLLSKKLTFVRMTGSEVIFRCPFCGDSRKHMNHGHLYINVEKGVFHCFRCGASGSVNRLLRLLGYRIKYGGGKRKTETDFSASFSRDIYRECFSSIVSLLEKGFCLHCAKAYMEERMMFPIRGVIIPFNFDKEVCLPEGFVPRRMVRRGVAFLSPVNQGFGFTFTVRNLAGEPKYVNYSLSGFHVPYLIASLSPNPETVFLVEGASDYGRLLCDALRTGERIAVIGYLGKSSLKRTVRLLSGFLKKRNVVVCFDADIHSEEVIQSLSLLMNEIGAGVEIYVPPYPFKDISSLPVTFPFHLISGKPICGRGDDCERENKGTRSLDDRRLRT